LRSRLWAIQKGVTYGDLQASNWAVSNRCLGCHVVTQAVVGGELTRRLTTFDAGQRNTLVNALTTYLQANGAVHASHPEYARTQTMLGLWALNARRDKDELAAGLTAVADYVRGGQDGAGAWSADHATGWWASRATNTAFNLKSLTEVVDTLKRVPLPTSYATQTILSGGGLNGTYYLEKNASGQVLVANYNVGSVMAVNTDGSAHALMSGLSRPQGLLQLADGTLLVATDSGIVRRASNGITSTIAMPATVGALALGPDGTVFAASGATNTIYQLGSNGAVSTYYSGGLLNLALGMAFDAEGNLYVANYSGQSVVRIRPDKSADYVVRWTNGNARALVRWGDGWLLGTNTGIYRYNSQWLGERLSFDAADGLVVMADGTIVRGDGGSTLARLVPIAVNGAAKIASYSTAIGSATNWLLNDANVNASSNLELAHRLIGLGAAQVFYAGTPTADTVLAKMKQIDAALRGRQQADGGWGVQPGYASDSLVTAQVGYALDTLHPPANDPVIQNAITLLLSRQQADGSWISENGVLSTRLAATTWVEIWLPIALDRIGGIDADVRLRFAPNVALSNPSLAPNTTASNPDGSTSYTWQLQGVTSVSRGIQFDLAFAGLQLGETRAAALDAQLGFRNSFTNDSVTAPVQIPSLTASAFLGLGVGTDRTEYGASDNIAIAGQVRNIGATATTGSVGFRILSQDGAVVADLGRVPFAELAAGATATVPVAWNTGATYAGQYLVDATLFDAANRQVSTARSALAIRAGSADGAATLTGTVRTDRTSYPAGATVQLTDRIANLATNQSIDQLRVETSIANPDGSVRWSASTSLAELVPRASRDLPYSVALGNASAGTYAVRLIVRNAFGTVVASDSKSFTVLGADVSGVGLRGSLNVPASVALGEIAAIGYSLVNGGNVALSNVPLTVRLADPASGVLRGQFPLSATLATGASRAGAVNWQATGQVGDIVAVLVATIAGKEQVLAQAPFKLTAPQVTVNLELAKRSERDARVLVLMTCKVGTTAQNNTCVTQRTTAMTAVLNTLGTSHRIVSTAAAFESEMRCGRYNVYWISGGANKLSAQATKEVREAVRRGDGLIEDGEFDDRSHLFEGTAGVIHLVDLPTQNNTAVIEPGSAFDAGNLATLGTAVGFSLTTGQAVARFGTDPAIVFNRYGEGASVLHAFSLTAMLAAPGGTTNPQLRALVQDTLDSTAADPRPLTAGDVTRQVTTVSNRGASAVAIEARATLPAGASVVDAAPAAEIIAATANTPAQVVWRAELAAGASIDLKLRISVDTDATASLQLPVQVSARPATSSSGAYTPQGSVTHTLDVVQGSGLNSAALAAIQALAPTSSANKTSRTKAITAANAAIGYVAQGNAAAALAEWVKAADFVASITTANAASVAAAQLAIARAMEATTDRLCRP
jgi:hypothetical protein